MSVTIVSRRFRGAKAGGARVVPLPSLAANVDHLAELRGLLKQAHAEERRLTAEILATMEAAGFDRLEGREAVAIRDSRTTLKCDPELLHAALGAQAFGAMTVSLTAARRLLLEPDLEAISEPITTPVLRVEPLTNGKAVA